MSRANFFRPIFLHSCLFFSFFLSAFVFANDKGLEKIKQNGVLKVCTEAGYIPLEMKTKEGAWLGFDPEMMLAYAKYLGVKLEIIDTKWDGIIPSLLAGKCQAIASSMAKTVERSTAVNFSNTYFVNELMIAVKDTKENREKFKSVADFNASSISVAVKTGSSPDLFLQDSHLLDKAKIFKYDADVDTVSAVLTGKTTAFIYDKPYVMFAQMKYKGKFYVVPNGFNGDEFGVAFQKQDTDLLKSFNQFLSQWKQSGAYEKVYNKYFTESQWLVALQ